MKREWYSAQASLERPLCGGHRQLISQQRLTATAAKPTKRLRIGSAMAQKSSLSGCLQ
jgi:hypothetical protein